MRDINRLYNCKNPYQGDYKRVLCVCSAGLLRSPTAAFVLANAPFNFNTRAAGLDAGHALIVVDDVLLEWADEIVCMNAMQRAHLQGLTPKPVINLNIPDRFSFRDELLIATIKNNYTAAINGENNEKTTDDKAASSTATENMHSVEQKTSETDK